MTKSSSRPAVKDRLRLNVGQIKALQAKHEIPNLLQPPTAKMANAEILAEIYYEGSRKWANPPRMQEIEEMEVGDLNLALLDYYSSITEMEVESTEGKP